MTVTASKRRRRRLLAATVAWSFSLWLWGCDKGTPVGRESGLSVDFSGGIVATDAWSGEWHVVVTFRECLTGATTLVEDVVDIVCPGDTLRLSGTGLFETCAGTATDRHLDVDCEYRFADGDCRVTVSMHLELDRDGEALTGTGAWQAATSLGCGALYPPGCESVSVSGTRLSADTSPCDTIVTARAPSILRRRR